jgi:hypothetical protein
MNSIECAAMELNIAVFLTTTAAHNLTGDAMRGRRKAMLVATGITLVIGIGADVLEARGDPAHGEATGGATDAAMASSAVMYAGAMPLALASEPLLGLAKQHSLNGMLDGY